MQVHHTGVQVWQRMLTQLPVLDGLKRHPDIFVSGRYVPQVQNLIGQLLGTHSGRHLQGWRPQGSHLSLT